MTLILDGQIIQDQKRAALSAAISRLAEPPRLTIIQVGDDPRSDVYIKRKMAFAADIGADTSLIKLPADVTEETLETTIHQCNADSAIHGIIVQLPLPGHLNAKLILNHIDAHKDVDALTAENKALLLSGTPRFLPATTKGVITLLDHYQIPIEGAQTVVLGRSDLVGKPTALALLARNATVTVAHSRTRNTAELTKHADIIVSAVGKPGLVTLEHVSPQAAIIDVGITVVPGEHKKIVGDADFSSLNGKVRAISPVPGGVGPLTIACLFENLLEAHHIQKEKAPK